MAKARITFDRKGNTLDIWFGDSRKEVICEETSEEVILKKDKKGKVIGIEILNFLKTRRVQRELPVHLAVQ